MAQSAPFETRPTAVSPSQPQKGPPSSFDRGGGVKSVNCLQIYADGQPTNGRTGERNARGRATEGRATAGAKEQGEKEEGHDASEGGNQNQGSRSISSEWHIRRGQICQSSYLHPQSAPTLEAWIEVLERACEE